MENKQLVEFKLKRAYEAVILTVEQLKELLKNIELNEIDYVSFLGA